MAHSIKKWGYMVDCASNFYPLSMEMEKTLPFSMDLQSIMYTYFGIDWDAGKIQYNVLGKRSMIKYDNWKYIRLQKKSWRQFYCFIFLLKSLRKLDWHQVSIYKMRYYTAEMLNFIDTSNHGEEVTEITSLNCILHILIHHDQYNIQWITSADRGMCHMYKCHPPLGEVHTWWHLSK